MSLRNRPEYVADIGMSLAGIAATGVIATQEVGLVNRIPLDKPLFGALLEVRYRMAVGATITGIMQAEGPQNFIQRIRIVGTHKRFGTRELVNLRGSTLYELEKKYTFGNFMPLVTDTTAFPATGVATVATTTYGANFNLYVPFVPRGLPKLQQMLFLVRNDEWATFDLYVTFGDATSIAKFAAGQVVTFTDFGSGAGTPRVRVSVIRSILGEARGLIQPAIMRRQFLPLTTVLTSASATDIALQDLDVGFKVLSYLVKTGTLDTTTTGGVTSYATLADSIVTRCKIKLDNVTIKDAISPLQARSYSASEFGAPLDTGYFPLEFLEGHDINTCFRGDMLNRSNKLQLAGDVTSAANQNGEVVEELIEGEPNIYQPSA